MHREQRHKNANAVDCCLFIFTLPSRVHMHYFAQFIYRCFFSLRDRHASSIDTGRQAVVGAVAMVAAGKRKQFTAKLHTQHNAKKSCLTTKSPNLNRHSAALHGRRHPVTQTTRADGSTDGSLSDISLLRRQLDKLFKIEAVCDATQLLTYNDPISFRARTATSVVSQPASQR